MKITAINNNYANSKKLNNNLQTNSNIIRLGASISFKGADKFVRNACVDTDKLYAIINAKFDRVMLPLKGNGEEQGLNRVAGLAGLKAGLYQDILMPLMDVMDGKPKHHLVPNGIHFFGPMGVGKTYVAKQLGEHYTKKGGQFEEIYLYQDETKDIPYIETKFAEAKKRFEQSDNRHYTMFFIDSIDCYLGKRGYNSYEKYIGLCDKFSELAKTSKNNGAILLTTSDFLERTEPRILSGESSLRIPLNYINDEDISEFINYYIKRHDLPNEGQIDYLEISNLVKGKGLKYTPKGIEKRIIEPFYDYVDYGEKVNTSDLIEAITPKRDFSSEAEQLKKFEREKAFANQLGGVYEY